MTWKIFSLGDNALTVEFGTEISPALNHRALRLADCLQQTLPAGLIEIVPAYASVTCFYDVVIVRKNYPQFPTAFDAVKKIVENALSKSRDTIENASRLMPIPVSFDDEFALDLKYTARVNNLSTTQVIEIFLAKTYRVYMLGFLPGFSYMGEVDERIATARKDAPRLRVPKGSVGIAGRQTGIYSLESPGGWQIIGRTNVELFTPNADQPTFLQAGDTVKFYESDF